MQVIQGDGGAADNGVRVVKEAGERFVADFVAASEASVDNQSRNNRAGRASFACISEFVIEVDAVHKSGRSAPGRIWPSALVQRNPRRNNYKDRAISVGHQPLRLPFRLSGLGANPLESPCGDQAHNQEVVAAEAGRVLPGVFLLIRSLEGDVEQGTFVGLLAPDARAYEAVADFVDWLAV
jgi:hypothetical protein